MIKRFIINTAQKYGCSNYFLKSFFLYRNFLKTTGWLKSIRKLSSIDVNGKPIPWFTYSSIHFLEERMNKSLEFFEYGSGNSTIWFSERVGQICSVESDKMWYDRIKETVGKRDNVQYLFEPDVAGGLYAKAIQKTNKMYDVIIIDGKDRNNCCYNCIDLLKPNGVIILDNSDYFEWEKGINFIVGKGFKRIDFWGLLPLVHYDSCTTIFYKSDNCLGI